MTFEIPITWQYKIYLHDCYHTTNGSLSSSDEELNAILSEGWEIDRFAAAANGDGTSAVFLLRRMVKREAC